MSPWVIIGVFAIAQGIGCQSSPHRNVRLLGVLNILVGLANFVKAWWEA